MSTKLTIPATDVHTIMCTPSVSISQDDLNRIQELQAKKSSTEKWFAKDGTELTKLQAKKEQAENGWQVSEGAKTLLFERYVKDKHDVRKIFSTTETARGNLVEGDIIRYASRFFGCELVKNTESKPIEKYGIRGICDVNPKENELGIGVDMKSVADFDKVHKPITTEHIWQCKAYCMTYGVKEWYLYRLLVPTPDNILAKKAWQEASNMGYEFGSDEHAGIVDKYKRYNDNIQLMPLEMRTNVFKVELLDGELEEWQRRYAKCAEYYKTIGAMLQQHKLYLDGIRNSVKS